MSEIWRRCIYNKAYKISNWGNFLNSRGHSLVFSGKGKYKFVCIQVNGKNKRFPLHRLILLHFRGKPKPEQTHTRHLDGNGLNNDLSNLKWGTPLENARDRIKHGTLFYGERNPLSKLTEEQVREIRKSKSMLKNIAKKYNINANYVWQIRSGRTWRHILRKRRRRSNVA